MGVVSQDSDGSRTDITFDLTPEQSLHHIVVTVVPFNGFGEGRATDILTKSDMSMPRRMYFLSHVGGGGLEWVLDGLVHSGICLYSLSFCLHGAILALSMV